MKMTILGGLLATALIGAAALPAAAHDTNQRGSSPQHRSNSHGGSYGGSSYGRHPGQSSHPGRGHAYGRYDRRDDFEHRCVRGETREQHQRAMRLQRERQQHSRNGYSRDSRRDDYRGRTDDRRWQGDRYDRYDDRDRDHDYDHDHVAPQAPSRRR